MAQTTSKWRREASEAELRERAKDMIREWGELSQHDRESDEFRTAKVQFLAEIEDIDTYLSLRRMEAVPAALRSAPDGVLLTPGTEYRTPGEIFVNDPSFAEWATRQAGKAHLTSESPTIEVRTLVTTTGDAAPEMLPYATPFALPRNWQRLFVRDLMTVVPTTLGAVPYYRELDEATTKLGASTVPEAGLKPEATIKFESDIAPVTVIAVNIPVTTQMMEDSSLLAAYINTRLVYMLKVREEQQILSGNGLAQDLKGIRNTVGIQTQTFTASEIAITIANALCKIEVVNGSPDSVVMNPVNAWAMFTKRAAGGSGTFDAGTPFSAIPMSVWGLPVLRTNGIESGKALVSDFKMGATLLDRKQASVRMYEQHSDWVVYNKILIQAENRVGILCNRADFFVVVDVA